MSTPSSAITPTPSRTGEAAGRSFKLYVGQHAALRAYITVIALPDGIADPYAFLQEQGWLEQADTYGELLFVLEPGRRLGTLHSEAAYLEACLGEVIGQRRRRHP